jgi:hypothetical protein
MVRCGVVAMLVALWLAVPGPAFSSAQEQADGSSLQFHFDRQGLAVPDYTFAIEQGGGTYTAHNVAAASANRYSVTSAPVETVQSFQLLPAHYARLVGIVEATHGLKGCASRAKGIADTGTKTLTWRKADALTVTCTYNYSESKPVVELTTTFEAMAFTLDEARRLEQLHRFDRLGLDAEMTILTDAVQDGRAQALEMITPALQALVNDPDVLERVRNRASKLIAESGTHL